MKLKEDAPVNAVGGGNIAGTGIGPSGEPGQSKSRMLRRGKFAGHETFIVSTNTFHKARMSKKDRGWWKKFMPEEEDINEIREFANKNPKKAVVLQDSNTGALCYARYGKK